MITRYVVHTPKYIAPHHHYNTRPSIIITKTKRKTSISKRIKSDNRKNINNISNVNIMIDQPSDNVGNIDNLLDEINEKKYHKDK